MRHGVVTNVYVTLAPSVFIASTFSFTVLTRSLVTF